MATRYVRKTGSDSNGGTSPSDAWLTIGKALGASGIASGDTVYVGAGTYRETVTVAMTSATGETSVIADTDGAQTGDAGAVIWSAYTTNDSTVPASAATLDLAGRDFLIFKKFLIIGGNAAGNCVLGNTAHSVNITLQDCTFIGGAASNALIAYTGAAGVAANWIIDRCRWFAQGSRAIILTLARHTADFDVNFLIKNCFGIALGSQNIHMVSTGSGTGFSGGVDILECTLIGGDTIIRANDANIATSIPSTVYGCMLMGGNGKVGIFASTSGQFTDDYNVVYAGTAHTSVTPGANTIAISAAALSRALAVELGQALVVGAPLKPFFTPMASSPLLGFGNPTGALSVDLLNRPRPAGGSTSNAVGALERHDTMTESATAVIAGGGNHGVITGPGDQDVTVLVPASEVTLSVVARYDTNHAATNKPQAILLADGELGVSGETLTMTASANTDETLTFTPFTPTKAGRVIVRLVSRSAASNGLAYFADLIPS